VPECDPSSFARTSSLDRLLRILVPGEKGFCGSRQGPVTVTRERKYTR
jgi:hypothetical protein